MSHELKELTSQEVELVAGGNGTSPAEQAKQASAAAYVKGIEDFTPEKFTMWTALGFRSRP